MDRDGTAVLIRRINMLEFRIRPGVHGEPSLEPPEPKFPRCPECNEEADTFFQNKDGYVIGCENCIVPIDAWEYARDFD